MSDKKESDLQSAVNEILLQNGWDYDDRKRVLFMLKNQKPRERTLNEAIHAVYRRYGNDLSAFFVDARREAKARAECRRLGGV